MKSEIVSHKEPHTDEFPKFWRHKKEDTIYMETWRDAVCICSPKSDRVGNVVIRESAHIWPSEYWERVTGELIIKYTI